MVLRTVGKHLAYCTCFGLPSPINQFLDTAQPSYAAETGKCFQTCRLLQHTKFMSTALDKKRWLVVTFYTVYSMYRQGTTFISSEWHLPTGTTSTHISACAPLYRWQRVYCAFRGCPSAHLPFEALTVWKDTRRLVPVKRHNYEHVKGTTHLSIIPWFPG